MITKAIVNAFHQARERHWPKTYWAFDIHSTMIVPNYSTKEIPTEFYPHAMEVMQMLSKRKDIVRILYTCSHPDEIAKYMELFMSHDIFFDYVNHNPDVLSEGYGYYEHKLYFNVLFEDKAGFDPLEDWIKVKELLVQYPQDYIYERNVC